MTSGQEIIAAAELLSESLDDLRIDRERWLLEIMVNSESNEWCERLVGRRESVGRLLSWPRPGRRKIPTDVIPRFILESLGIDFLRIEKIREVMLSGLQIRSAEKFQQLTELLLSHGAESESIGDLSMVDFRMGTALSQSYCSHLGLPESFAYRGTSDNRSGMEIIRSVKRLPPLIDFQERIQSLAKETFESEHGRAMIVMPTGSGKTRTSIEATLGWLLVNSEWPSTLVWIADREELCEQAFQSFKQIFVHLCQELEEKIEVPEYTQLWRYWGGLDSNTASLGEQIERTGIVVTSVQQLQARMRNSDEIVEQILSTPSVVIVDEAHRNLDFIEELDIKFRSNECNTRMIGLTATPMRRERSESSRLIQLFEGNVLCPIEGAEYDIDVMITELTGRKILAARIDVDPYQLIDYSSLNSQIGEQGYLEKIVQLICKVRDMGRKSILVFTREVEHARILSSCLRLQDSAIPAQFLDSNTPSEQRKTTIRQFKDEEIGVLLNFGILTTGFDAPNTDAVIICRPMDQDDSLFRQMVGRGLRGTEFGGTPDCIIVHFEEDF
jgi:superfamily II DNA or RNA helicase